MLVRSKIGRLAGEIIEVPVAIGTQMLADGRAEPIGEDAHQIVQEQDTQEPPRKRGRK